ncbi:MAG: beta-lactamase family protein [Francisellaceae bacterium]|jgi:hypothetical protein|nr:beta-lactamase family protein [Francisellaceae bacterium]MBT6207424.1 beta-lactamase family protein [Francisellaceae bacterium]MBT6538512.1 beta-lactamase family protein [Francisellaceae bacterium]
MPLSFSNSNAAENQTLIDRMNELKVPGVSMAVIDQSGEVTPFCYSTVIEENITKDTLFQAASMSKPIAAMGILACVHNHGIGLDDDIRPKLADHGLELDGFEGDGITIRQLLSHTAGLNVHGFRGYPENREITTKEVLEGAIISHAWFMQVSEEDLNVDILLSKIGDDQVPIILRCEGQHYIYGHDGSIPHIKKLEKSSREPSPLVEA